jgi:hypothetical protein
MITTHHHVSLGLGLALAAAAPVALAQTATDQPAMPPMAQQGEHHRGGGPRGFDAMDTNHDGFVTLEEWTAARRRPERFAQIDSGHTGKITREQIVDYMKKWRAEHPKHGDETPVPAPTGTP